MKKRTLNELLKEAGPIANFVRTKRKKLGYTQLELAKRIGVGLRFLKELEQGKKSLRLDKVAQVLNFFGYEIAPILKKKELLPFEETNQ
jgi:y4mF family transcriptional regulator